MKLIYYLTDVQIKCNMKLIYYFTDVQIKSNMIDIVHKYTKNWRYTAKSYVVVINHYHKTRFVPLICNIKWAATNYHNHRR